MTLLNDMYTIVDDSAGACHLRLHADHPIFRAHFPGRPVTPGVCLVKIVAEVVGRQLQCPLELRRIVNLKFVSVISPVETPCLTLTFQVTPQPTANAPQPTANTPQPAALWRVKGTFSHHGQVFTKFSLELSEQ